ncbi:hypothetical protein HX001_07880 [Empedobacter brevis]|uniref:Uncharacterized protein n=1 Tax=Empedobacter brevis TaxID=247 RepID=A0AAJ1QE74_9FLAO|nr:hypothetical protein [Empedobacter brevis]MDM1072406.1 hypothetical protein [Empedobacter brevis]
MNDMISGADAGMVNIISSKQPGTNPTFRIYTRYDKQYKTYDENGIELNTAIITIPKMKK